MTAGSPCRRPFDVRLAWTPATSSSSRSSTAGSCCARSSLCASALTSHRLELHPPVERIRSVISAGTDDVLAGADAAGGQLAFQLRHIRFQARPDVLRALK